jgi:hypothetical protein
VAKAVEQTIKEVGKDPNHKSQFLFWPISSADFTIASSKDQMTGILIKAH